MGLLTTHASRSHGRCLPSTREFAVIVLLVIGLNGFALLQHLGVVPELSGFIAATLLANMFTAPIIVWAAYVFGHIAEDRYQHRKHRHPA